MATAGRKGYFPDVALKFYAGVVPGAPQEQVTIRVVPFANGKPKDLWKVRVVSAPDRDAAARKYIEQTTGGRAAMRRPS